MIDLVIYLNDVTSYQFEEWINKFNMDFDGKYPEGKLSIETQDLGKRLKVIITYEENIFNEEDRLRYTYIGEMVNEIMFDWPDTEFARFKSPIPKEFPESKKKRVMFAWRVRRANKLKVLHEEYPDLGYDKLSVKAMFIIEKEARDEVRKAYPEWIDSQIINEATKIVLTRFHHKYGTKDWNKDTVRKDFKDMEWEW